MNRFLPVVLLLTSAVASTAVRAQSTVPLFASEEPLSAVLTLPLQDIYRQAKQDKQLYMPGHFTYKDEDGELVRVPVRSRTRGVFRRQNCVRPPLRLNFKKSDLPGTVLAGQDKLKLVNPCSVAERMEKYLALEYLAYKVYAAISDRSFDVRLIEMSFQDTGGKVKPWQTMTFVIEDEEEMVKRVGGKPLKDQKISRQTVDRAEATRVELFQYLIGNTDFSLYASAPGRDCCHNIKHSVEGDPDSPRLIPVPYDFDSSGIVNAPYAEPPDSLPIPNVRRRYYMGYCREERYLDEAIAHFIERKQAVLDVFNSDLLDEKTRKKTLDYVNDFYEILESPKEAERNLYKKCRGKVVA